LDIEGGLNVVKVTAQRACGTESCKPLKFILKQACHINVLISEVTTMKKLLLVLALLSVAAFSATPAKAGVVVGVGFNFGGPGYYGGYYGPPPCYYGYGPAVYFGPGYYPWYHGYWGGGYYRGYGGYYGHGGYYGGYRGGYGGGYGHGGYGYGGGYHGGGGGWHH
jgi:hypothetical protein